MAFLPHTTLSWREKIGTVAVRARVVIPRAAAASVGSTDSAARQQESGTAQHGVWAYGYDLVRAASPSARKKDPLICLHTSTGLGVNRTYWSRMFDLLRDLSKTSQLLADRDVYSFDWIGTGDSRPKPESISQPYTADVFAEQLRSFIRTLGVPRAVLLAQGAAEPVALRVAASDNDGAIAALVICNGVSPKYLDREIPSWRKQLSFGVLTSLAGDVFWRLVANRSYIEGFSRKNILLSDAHMQLWVSLAVEGSRDRRVRFNVYSFISGYLFGDYRGDLRAIQAPTLYLAGDLVPAPNARSRVQSARPPVPIAVQEGSFREPRTQRAGFHIEHIARCDSDVISGAGPEMCFESPEPVLSALEKWLQDKAL